MPASDDHSRASAPGPAAAGASLRPLTARTVAHFAGRDARDGGEPPDAVERWGRRIGRALSLAGFLALALYLGATYLR